MVPRRIFLLVVFATIFTFIFFAARPLPYYLNDDASLRTTLDRLHSGSTTPKGPKPSSCIEHLGWLEPYQFTSPIQYVSRDIIARPRADGQRPSLTVVDQPLFESFATVNLAESQTLRSDRCLPPLELEVPQGSMMPVDASNMIFGLQTTIGRLRDTAKHLARWLPHTGARLYAIVIDIRDNHEARADNNEMRILEKQMRNQGININILHPVVASDTFAQRYVSLVNVMYRARDDKTQWIVTIDDDTFFPSMFNLQKMLEQHDWQKPHYIGSLSEDWWSVNHYGLMAFGGAGVMLSLPMAKIIDEHIAECKTNLRTTAGDVSIMDCVYRFSPTKLTHVPSLHQVDMHGDLSGFYESGREILSLHHWKEGSAAGYKLEMEKMHLVADICDSCFLQRWQFQHDLVLSNGFSIAAYPEGHLSGKRPGTIGGTVDKLDLDLMEETWADEINVLHSLAPTRERLSEEQKVDYKLLDSMSVDGSEVGAPGEKVIRQIYFKEGGEGEGRDTVMVLNWRSGPPAPAPDNTGTDRGV
jgi:hypothetical protein